MFWQSILKGPFGRHEQNVFKSSSLSLSGHNNHNGSTTVKYPTDHKWLFLFVCVFCFAFVFVLKIFDAIFDIAFHISSDT